jgi:ribosomal protein S18 acetylase RimI-like enzyme
MLPPLRRVGPEEWRLLRLARLTALKDSPDAFLATHAREKMYSREQWLAEFDRGDWFIGELGEKPVCMVGVTHESGAPPNECYLEYVWVAPGYRRSRGAYTMLTELLDGLKKSGIRTVFLWVLEGNEVALWLYKRLNFQPANHRQPLPNDPRYEEKLKLELAERPVPVAATPELSIG